MVKVLLEVLTTTHVVCVCVPLQVPKENLFLDIQCANAHNFKGASRGKFVFIGPLMRIVIVFSLTEATPTPSNGPETDPQPTRNGAKRTRNGPERTEIKPPQVGRPGGVCRDGGGGGGCKGKRKSLHEEVNEKQNVALLSVATISFQGVIVPQEC